MNVDVIRRAVDVKPEEMNMDDWNCGTAHCIAGNCVIQNLDDEPVESICGAAIKLMGITYTQGTRLFYEDFWPLRFVKRGLKDIDNPAFQPGTQEYLDRVKARVEYFIATGGK